MPGDKEWRAIVEADGEARKAARARKYERAIAHSQKAIEHARSLARPRVMAVLYGRLAEGLDAMGKSQDALTACETALRHLEAVPGANVEGLVPRFSGHGKSYDDPNKVFALLPTSVEPLPKDLDKAERDPALVVRLLLNVGNLYLAQPQAGLALQRYQEALARTETAKEPALRARLLTQATLARGVDADLARAAQDIEEALRLFGKHAPLARRHALFVRASIEQRSDVVRAIATLQDSLPLYVKAGDRRGRARTLANLGNLRLLAGRVEDAHRAFKAALAALDEGAAERTVTYSDDKGRTHRYTDHHGEAYAFAYVQWGLGRSLRALGRPAEATAALEQSVEWITEHRLQLGTDQGKVGFLGVVADVFDDLLAFLLERAAADPAKYNDALRISETVRGKAIQDMIDARRHGMPANTMDWWRRARRADDGRVRARPSPRVRLVFHVLATRTVVFARGADGRVHGHIAALGRDDLESLVAAFRARMNVGVTMRGMRVRRADESSADESARGGASAIPAPSGAASVDPGRALYDALIAPVEHALPAGATVVIEPHGALWLLPFAALRAADGAWLADRWPLLYTPSNELLTEILSEPDGGRPADLDALLVGNPTMPRALARDGLVIELDPLPGAEEEVQEIARLLGRRGDVLLGAAADRQTVEARMGEYGIVHLATHGVALPDPLESCVILAASADGEASLTARRILDLTFGRARPLKDTTNPHEPELEEWRATDLVVLSACQTGLGAVTADGVIGLCRALLVAGARTVVVSLWSVDDDATRLLMREFYRLYLETEDKAVALQRAMEVLRGVAAYADPRYWSPFIVVGAPTCGAAVLLPKGSTRKWSAPEIPVGA